MGTGTVLGVRAVYGLEEGSQEDMAMPCMNLGMGGMVEVVGALVQVGRME